MIQWVLDTIYLPLQMIAHCYVLLSRSTSSPDNYFWSIKWGKWVAWSCLDEFGLDFSHLITTLCHLNLVEKSHDYIHAPDFLIKTLKITIQSKSEIPFFIASNPMSSLVQLDLSSFFVLPGTGQLAISFPHFEKQSSLVRRQASHLCPKEGRIS